MELHPEYVVLIASTLLLLIGAFITHLVRAVIWKTKVEGELKALQQRDPEIKELIEGVRLRVEESERVQTEQHNQLAGEIAKDLASLKEDEAEARRPLHQGVSDVRAEIANLRGYLAGRDEAHPAG